MLLHHVSERVRGRVLLVYGKRHHLQQTLWRGWTPWQLAYNQKVAHTENEQAFAAMERDYERHAAHPSQRRHGPRPGYLHDAVCGSALRILETQYVIRPFHLPLPPVSPPVLILRDDDTMIVQSPIVIVCLRAHGLRELLFCICLACIAHAQRASRTSTAAHFAAFDRNGRTLPHSLASQAPYMQLAEEESTRLSTLNPPPHHHLSQLRPHRMFLSPTAHVHMAMDETPRASPDLPQHLVEQDQLQSDSWRCSRCKFRCRFSRMS